MDIHILKTEIGSTEIVFQSGLKQVESFADKRRVILLTDSHLASLYQESVSGFEHIELPIGEDCKTLTVIEEVAANLLKKGIQRDDLLIGFGGGSICDFTGFLASVYKRGMAFGFVPTTLLAQVDAGIGGKNGVNIGDAKNMIGRFNAPEFVLIDPNYNITLENTRYRDGFAEVIKHAFIADEELVRFLWENHHPLLAKDIDALTGCIRVAAQIKKQIVMQDVHDTGERKKLNFGHTIGHAIERKIGISHGQAVSIGMAGAIQVSEKMGFLTPTQANEGKELIEAFDLPVKNPLSVDAYWDLVKQDKKTSGQKIDYIVLDDLGRARVERMTLDHLKSLLT